MALDTYSNLKSAVKTWTHRTDLDDAIDDIIDMAENAMFANQEAVLSVREMEATTSTSLSAQTLALPTGFLNIRSMKLTEGGVVRDCSYVAPEALKEQTASGIPEHFTITSQFKFDRAPSGTITATYTYQAKPTALSSSNTTNTILTNYPNIYLQGCLWAAYLYAGEEDKANNCWANFINAIKGANKAYKRANYGPAPAAMAQGSTP